MGGQGSRTIVFARLIQGEKAEPDGAGLRARAAFMTEFPPLLDSPAH
jgi:hypothetical protein